MSLSRRDFSRRVLAGIAATSVAGSAGCGSSDGAGGGAGVGGAGGTGATAGAGGVGGASACVLYPQQTAGPFYLDLDSLRQDITEGKAGAALRLEVLVQDQGCDPLKDLAVDLWHCDALGVYSGFPGQLGGLDTTGQTFLRGTQITDAAGLVAFETIYPGWYPGRTTHLHFRVHTSSTTEATSQIYFPEDITSAVYELAPYDTRGQKDTPNDLDGINVANRPPLATVSGNEVDGYIAQIAVTVG